MDRLPPPPGLILTGNLAENWRRFEQQYNVYAVASGVASKADKVQGMTLRHVLGPDAIDVYYTFTLQSAIDICRAAEVSESQLREMGDEKNVHAIKDRKQRY